MGEPNDKRRTFARRYVPSEGVAAIRFKAIQEVYEAEIGPALKRQSSYQEIGFELGALGLSGDMGFEYLCQRFKFISMEFFFGGLRFHMQDGFFKLCMRSMKTADSFTECRTIARNLVPEYLDTPPVRF